LFTIAVNTGPLDPVVLSDSGANIVFDSMKELYDQWDTFSKNKITKDDINSIING